MATIELNVPDIGDATDVDVIEVLVEVGDVVQAEQGLVTVESDKASMEIPAARSGTVEAVLVAVGDKVSEGSPLVRLRSDDEDETPPTSAPTEQEKPVAAQEADKAGDAAPSGDTDKTPPSAPEAATGASSAQGSGLSCDVVVVGAGPGGYSAAFRAADLGLEVVLIERYPTLGGVCLNVGCIPSKALLHTAGVLEAAQDLAKQGIVFGAPEVDLDALRSHKDEVVGKLTTGLAAMAKARKVTVLTGRARFIDKHSLTIESNSEEQQTVRFSSAIVAAGSQAVQLPFLPDDERIVDSTGALQLPRIPKNMLVIGGGIIGLEMATVYSALGTRIDIVEMLDGLMQGVDRDLVRTWQKKNAHRFDRIMLNTRTVRASAGADGIEVEFEGENAPDQAQVYDFVLQAAGRRPNGDTLGLEHAGVTVDEHGFIPVDRQMRTNVPHIYAIGDIVGQPMLAHKAVHEAHVAAQVIAGEKSYFDARVIPSVSYTDPEIAWVGLTEDQAKAQGHDVVKGVFPWMASGRAIANTRDEGVTKLLFDAETNQIVGGGIVGTNAGDLIGEIALAIEMGADSIDIANTIHPHPTLGESIGMAAQAALGICTDLPPTRRR